MSNNDLMVAGVDIGSSKTCAVILEKDSQTGKREVTGVGTSANYGLRKGVVTNIEATLRSVESAISGAELMSGRNVKSCWIGIGGSHVTGIPSRGAVAVRKTRENRSNSEAREISREDIKRVLDISREVMIPLDKDILEVIPQCYIVDGQRGFKDPVEMLAIRLEVESQIITCSTTGGLNLVKCVNRAGFKVSGMILQTRATGTAVLLPGEADLGVAIVDLGGGTTDIIMYFDGAPYAIATIPAGGIQVTNDISVLKKVSVEYAEKIKLDAGCCWEPFLDVNNEILVPAIGDRKLINISRAEILSIIKPRVEEILKAVGQKIQENSVGRQLGAGIILTGGGALLPGIAELASEMFNLPVRVGIPRVDAVLAEDYQNPVYATAIGIAMEGFIRQGEQENTVELKTREKEAGSIIKKIGSWFHREIF